MSTMREIQLCAFDILVEVVRVCEKNGLTYYLNFGTLLGAVRHKGFIPWDNDIDIEMPIGDYLKFLKIAPKEISKDFFVQTYKTDPGFNLLWTQVRANNTTSLPVKFANWDIHWGMHIDIFPLVRVFDGKFQKKFQEKALCIARALVEKEYLTACDPDQITNNSKLQFLYKLPRFLREKVCDMILRLVLKDPFRGKACSALERDVCYHLDPAWYQSKTKVEFEGHYFDAPENYDAVLTAIYGDYMTPPPESERFFGHEGTHGKIIYDHMVDFKIHREALLKQKL